MAAQDNISYYDVLEVTPTAGDSEIKDAYRRLALKYHPDQNWQEQKLAALRFKLLNEAYGQLKTREGRSRYNAALRRRRRIPTADNDNTDGFFTRLLRKIFKGGKGS